MANQAATFNQISRMMHSRMKLWARPFIWLLMSSMQQRSPSQLKPPELSSSRDQRLPATPKAVQQSKRTRPSTRAWRMQVCSLAIWSRDGIRGRSIRISSLLRPTQKRITSMALNTTLAHRSQRSKLNWSWRHLAWTQIPRRNTIKSPDSMTLPERKKS